MIAYINLNLIKHMHHTDGENGCVAMRYLNEFDKFYSGNVHLHYKNVSRSVADHYTYEVPRADGLDVVFFSYLERKGSDQYYPSNKFTLKDLENFSEKSGVLFG